MGMKDKAQLYINTGEAALLLGFALGELVEARVGKANAEEEMALNETTHLYERMTALLDKASEVSSKKDIVH